MDVLPLEIGMILDTLLIFYKKNYDATIRLSGSLYVTFIMYFIEACAIESFLLGWVGKGSRILE